MKLYKVTASGNTIYIHSHSWFDIFNSLYTQHKLLHPSKPFKGCAIIPVKKSTPKEVLTHETAKHNLIHQLNLPHILKCQAH